MISKKYKEIIKNLEENIDSKRDLEYAKGQISDLTALYIDELSKVIDRLENKVKRIEEELSNIEKNVEKIEEDVYSEELNEIDELDIELEPIECPYCNFQFLIHNDSNQKEIKCPKCENIIELDWDEYEEDM